MIKENPKTTLFVGILTYSVELVFQLGFNILIFRQFSLEEVGAYGLIIAIAAFAGAALDMGISPTLIRGFSQNTLSFSQAVLGSAALRMPILVLGLGTFAVWLHFTSASVTKVAVPLALAVLSQALMSFRAIATSWLRAHDRQNIANLLNLLGGMGYFCIGIILLYSNQFNLYYFFLGSLLINLAITLLSFVTTNKYQVPLRIRQTLTLSQVKNAISSLWTPSLVFTFIIFCNVVRDRADWLMLYYYASETELAYYTLANKILEIFAYSMIVVVEILLPWMCKMILTKDRDPRIIIWYKVITFFYMILAVVLALYLPGFLTIFWGAKFEKANNLIFILMSGGCLVPIYCFMYYIAISINKERILLITVAFSTIVQVLSNFILIPRYGSFGAALGMIILTCISFLILSIYFVKDRMNEFMPISRLVIIFFITILGLYFFRYHLQPTYHNNIIFLVCLFSGGTFLIMSRSERFLLMKDIKATARALKNRMGRNAKTKL